MTPLHSYNPSMRTSRLPLVASLAVLSLGAAASDALIAPGDRLAVIDTPHLHALVPAEAATALKPRIARAEVIYAAMAKDAGYTPRRLTLLVTDDLDTHNGFSTVTPLPIINVQLAPSLAPSSIFCGEDEFERTLVHELTHHISNDRDPNGFRHTLANIFGRILPNDVLSLAVAYLSTPAHQTMPSFWHEGCAQWAETEYATGPVWAGRGRDSLTHMVWRLDAAAGTIPEPGDWRLSYQEWPFGSQAYLYGVAYTRYLAGAVDDRASIWQLIERQEHRWAFAFNGGPEPLLHKDHLTLIAEARSALLSEQLHAIETLKTRPITSAKRLTPINGTVAAPAWLPDGRLFAAYNSPYDDPEFVTVDAAGNQSAAGYASWLMGSARSLPDGTLVFSDANTTTDPWNRSRVSVVWPDGGRTRFDHERLLQPDIRLAGHADEKFAKGKIHQIAAIQLNPDGTHSLVVFDTWAEDRLFFNYWRVSDATRLSTEGSPWSPVFTPEPAPIDALQKYTSNNHREPLHSHLTWVETDATGSRLVTAPLTVESTNPQDVKRTAALGERTILIQLPGRILQPTWSADGKYLYFCADHSGVANAYRLDPTKPGELTAVTNTIGGVLACVPSPDGRELAIVDHDRHGPFLARIANDPATWPGSAPTILLAWPAPVGKHAGAEAAKAKPRFSLPAEAGDAAALTVEPYHGVTEIRPLFWTPTTYAVPEGGFGVVGMMADPIFSHEMIGSAGVGLHSGSPVGLASYAYGGWPIDIGAVAWQAERSYDEQIVASDGNLYDYVEDRRSVEVRLGHGLTGTRRRFQLYAAAGLAEYNAVHSAEKKYAGLATFNLQPFTDTEQYTEVTLAYSDATLFPTSYTLEDGTSFAAQYRHSGYGGEMHQDRVIGLGTYVFSFWPRYGQQLVFGGALGWTEGDEFLQNQFSVGGTYGLNQLPRGYGTTQALGQYLVGGSVAYRTPVWRPFWGHSTTPFVDRQTILELFFDAAKVSSDRLDGNGDWYRSVGANLHMNWMVWELMVNPGIGIAYQLDGEKDVRGLFGLDFIW